MKNSSTAFLGLAVHKNSIDIAIAEAGLTGKIRHYEPLVATLILPARPSANYARDMPTRSLFTKPGPATMRSTAIFAVRGCRVMSLLLH